MITCLYIVSNLACLSTIFIGASYLTSIGLLILQGVSVAFFILRVFAGGENAQQKLQGMVTAGASTVKQSMFQSIMSYIVSNPESASKLPF